MKFIDLADDLYMTAIGSLKEAGNLRVANAAWPMLIHRRARGEFEGVWHRHGSGYVRRKLSRIPAVSTRRVTGFMFSDGLLEMRSEQGFRRAACDFLENNGSLSIQKTFYQSPYF